MAQQAHHDRQPLSVLSGHYDLRKARSERSSWPVDAETSSGMIRNYQRASLYERRKAVASAFRLSPAALEKHVPVGQEFSFLP
jgi:hypothetical protein